MTSSDSFAVGPHHLDSHTDGRKRRHCLPLRCPSWVCIPIFCSAKGYESKPMKHQICLGINIHVQKNGVNRRDRARKSVCRGQRLVRGSSQLLGWKGDWLNISVPSRYFNSGVRQDWYSHIIIIMFASD